MISVVNKKRKLIIYAINLIGLVLYPFFFVLRNKWRNARKELLRKLQNNEIGTIGINCTDRLGDILFLTPVLKALRKSYPSVKLTVFTNKTGQEIFKSNPAVDEIIVVDNFWSNKSLVNIREFVRSFNASYFKTIREIRRKKLDVILEVKGDFRNIVLFDIFLGAQYLVGYALSGFGWMLDWELEYQSGMHEIDAKLRIAELLGAKATDRGMELFLSPDDERFADEFLCVHKIGHNDMIAVFHVGGTWEPRLWPVQNFIEIEKKLKQKYGAKIILIGDKRDEEKNERFQHAVPEAVRLNKATITQSAAVIKKADIYLGNDSGPLHLARCVKTPLVGIFGPEDLWRVGPEHDGIALQHKFACQPCGQVSCPYDPNCVQSVTVEEVWQAIDLLLRRNNRGERRKMASE